MANPILIAKAGAIVLTDEKARKAAGWVLVAVLSPLILFIAFLCSLGSGTSSHNISAVELCFNGGAIPDNMPAEYRACLEEMQNSLDSLDETVSTINDQTENGASLDATRVKAVFYALYFGSETQPESQWFTDCFVTYEERTRMVPVEGSDPPAQTEEKYTVAVLIGDMSIVWQNIASTMGVTPTAEQQSNADSVYNLIQYGVASGGSGFAGSDVPFIGADGFCSPIGPNWRNIVTSEFGGRVDPITGKRDSHNGMDLAVPAGTPVRAALPGTVTVAKYHKQLRQLCQDKPRQRAVHSVRPQLQAAGSGWSDGSGGRYRLSVRLHRAVHRSPSALRGMGKRTADQSTQLLAINSEGENQ